MIAVRRAEERGSSKIDWLDSRHTFSFADYYDPKHMGFGPLRVINDDRVRGGAGFGTHGHRDMEIVSIVLSGALEHKDSLGTGSIIRPGDVQRMSAGTGVRHSEWNHSPTDPVRFLQIWIVPERAGLPPSYEQKRFEDAETTNTLRLVASRDGREGSVTVHQDAAVYIARLLPDARVTHALAKGRRAFVQVAEGELMLSGHALREGDGAAIEDASELTMESTAGARLVLFDLPG